MRLRVLVSAIKSVPHSFLFDCLLAVLDLPGVAVRAWSTTAGGGDSYPCRCKNGGDHLVVDLLDVSLAYLDTGAGHPTSTVQYILMTIGRWPEEGEPTPSAISSEAKVRPVASWL